MPNNSFQWYFLVGTAETEHQGIENYCCDEVIQNCVLIKWNARTTSKNAMKPRFLWSLWQHFHYFEAATLSRTKLRWRCFSPDFSLSLSLKYEQPFWGQKRSRHDILAHIWLSAPFFTEQSTGYLIILQQVRKLQHKALRSPLLCSNFLTPTQPIQRGVKHKDIPWGMRTQEKTK